MANKVAEHPSAEELTDFLLGRLNQTQADRIAQHIDTCSSCCEVLQDVPDDRLVRLARMAIVNVSSSGDTSLTAVSDTNSDVVPQSEGFGVVAQLADHPRYRILERVAWARSSRPSIG